MPRSRRWISAGLILAGVLAGPAVARADWSAPEIMSTDGSNVGHFAVGMDGAGGAVTVWDRTLGSSVQLQTRTRTADGTRSPVQVVSPDSSASSTLRIAVAPDGLAVIAWSRVIGGVERVQVRQLSAAGVLGPTLTLSASGRDASLPGVAIDPDGDALVVWQRFDGTDVRVQARTVSAGGTLGPTQNLSPAGVSAVESPAAVGLDAAGNAVIAWLIESGDDSRVQAVVRAAGGTLGPARTLSPAAPTVGPQVAVAPNGRAVVAWEWNDGSNTRAQVRGLDTAGTAPGPTQTLSAAGTSAHWVDVAIAPSGVATIVWVALGSPNRLQLRTRGADAGGTLGPILTLTNTDMYAVFPDVAVNGSGDVMVGWLGSDSFGPGSWVRDRSGSGVLGPIQKISPKRYPSSAGPVDLFHPPVAVARASTAGGGAAAAWRAIDAGSSIARLDLAAGP